MCACGVYVCVCTCEHPIHLVQSGVASRTKLHVVMQSFYIDVYIIMYTQSQWQWG